MMAYLTRRQKFAFGGVSSNDTILPKPNPLSPQERNQKVFDDYVGRMKKYLGAGVGMPEWFVKDLILEKAEELGVELKAGGGRIGLKYGGTWADWKTNFEDQMTFEEYLQMDLENKKPHFLDRKADGGRIGFSEGSSAIAFGREQKIFSPKVFQRLLSATGKKENLASHNIVLKALKQAGITYNAGTSRLTKVTPATIKKFNKIATKLRGDADLPMSRYQSVQLKKDIKTFVKNKLAAGEYVSRPIILEEFGLHKKKGLSVINRSLGIEVAPDRYAGGLLDKLGQTEKTTQALKNLEKAKIQNLTSSDENLKAINKEFLWNVDVASSEEIAKNIFGNDFPKGDKSTMSRPNLLKAEALVRDTDNAIMTYLKILEGKREIPDGMKLPSQKVINDITDNILHGIEDETLPGQGSRKKGFRFSDGVLREYKFAIVDQALGLNSGSYSAARKKFRIPKKVVDEVFSLSTMAGKGSGYTTAVQNISAAVNNKKAKQIDGPFQKIINGLDAGKKTMQWNYKTVPIEQAIADFNNTSKKFSQKHKIQTPEIHYGEKLDKTILKPYDEVSQKNIKDVHSAKKYYLSGVNKNIEMGNLAKHLSYKDQKKLSTTIQSILNKQNSGLNIVDIAKWGKGELSALDDIAGKIPSKALGMFGKVLKVAGIASIPLDVVPFVQARDLGVDKWGAVGGKNLAEMYVNLPGMVWEGGRWVKSKLQGKDHEWKLPYEAQFGQRATAKELRETSEEDLIKNITAQAEASKKIHAGQQIDTTWSDEKLNNQINKALELKKYYDSNPDVLTEKETIVDNTQEIEKPEKFGIYANQIKNLKV